MADQLQQTPVHPWHIAQKANMSEFGGFDMPLWYASGIKNEHFSVLKTAGIFDTSHMGGVAVTGADAKKFLDRCFTRSMESILENHCLYGAFLNDQGHCIDDAIIYCFSDKMYLVCVNAGMGNTICNHLLQQTGGLDVNLLDISGQMAKIDIQGPCSAKTIAALSPDPDAHFQKLRYFSFCGNFHALFGDTAAAQTIQDIPVLISRSGYTGEFGFEIFVAPENTLKLWERIIEAGKKFDALACGLGARDSLRAGAGLPLSHQDIGDFPFIRHPWEFALPFKKDRSGFTKAFTGSKLLLSSADKSFTLAFAADSIRKIPQGIDSRVVDQDGEDIGHVLTCVTDMAIDWNSDQIVSINTDGLSDSVKIKGLACGFIRVSRQLTMGTGITLVQGKRKIKATIVDQIRPDKTARLDIKNFL